MQEESGTLPLEGPGVIVEAADAPGGYLWAEIVHDQDIREIVNSLYHAGAEGWRIGSWRLGTAGWVRCVGPVVVVNGETVAANPIVIRAVGVILPGWRRAFGNCRRFLPGQGNG